MNIGKLLIVIGIIIVIIGVIFTIIPKLNFFGRLPGDFKYESDKVKIYIPVVTSIVISIILTLIFWLFSYFSRK